MPSDNYYSDLYEAEDKFRFNQKQELIQRFNNMTLEEKVNFLIDEYIGKECSIKV